ncbi:unnamed protein product [Rangifer tarandus platyrhynchus]|uniref:Uncharacterized protein n=1 Tax=Rangifer tarandus platyrhynchus TaxID=3082113 RepID=A0ABN8XPH4_RANTA|nr:unnamed protein product [Rangifer tarandus platyrhynchus]
MACTDSCKSKAYVALLFSCSRPAQAPLLRTTVIRRLVDYVQSGVAIEDGGRRKRTSRSRICIRGEEAILSRPLASTRLRNAVWSLRGDLWLRGNSHKAFRRTPFTDGCRYCREFCWEKGAGIWHRHTREGPGQAT